MYLLALIMNNSSDSCECYTSMCLVPNIDFISGQYVIAKYLRLRKKVSQT
jgi:hypothetical protein